MIISAMHSHLLLILYKYLKVCLLHFSSMTVEIAISFAKRSQVIVQIFLMKIKIFKMKFKIDSPVGAKV